MLSRLALLLLTLSACAVPTLGQLGPKACNGEHPCAAGFDCIDGVCSIGADSGLVDDRGASEFDCADGLDDDGDGLTDCADPDCLGQACDDRNACTTGDTCLSAGCTGIQVGCNSP